MFFKVSINGQELRQEFEANNKADVIDHLTMTRKADLTRDVILIEEIEPAIETGKVLTNYSRFDRFASDDDQIKRHLHNMIKTYGPELLKDIVGRELNMAPKRQRKLKVA